MCNKEIKNKKQKLVVGDKIRSQMSKNKVTQLAKLLSSFGELQEAERKVTAKMEMWGESPFFWLALAAPATKGAAGKKLVMEICKENGMSVWTEGRKVAADLTVEGRAVVVKFALLGENDTYFFEQVRDTDYEFLFCLGISPQAVHAWVFLKDVALQNMRKQRQGEKWVHVQPSNPPGWMRTQSGKLADVCDTFRELLKK